MLKSNEFISDYKIENANQVKKPTFLSETFIYFGFTLLLMTTLMFLSAYLIDYLVNSVWFLGNDSMIYFAIYMIVLTIAGITGYFTYYFHNKKPKIAIPLWIITIVLISIVLSSGAFWINRMNELDVIKIIFLYALPFLITSLTYFVIAILEICFKSKIRDFWLALISIIIGTCFICLINTLLIPIYYNNDDKVYMIEIYAGDYIALLYNVGIVTYLMRDFSTDAPKKILYSDLKSKTNIPLLFALEIWMIWWIVLIKLGRLIGSSGGKSNKKNYDKMSKDELIKENITKDSVINDLTDKNKK